MQTTHFMTSMAMATILIGTQAAEAQSLSSGVAPGSYRCSSYNVSGGGGSCRTMPRLVLQPDGGYQFSSTRGRWDVRKDGSLALSDSKIWGPGAILGPGTIRFEYDYNGRRHVVTWACQDCAEGGTGATAAQGKAAGAAVGVSLQLDFADPVGGVSGYTIVPAESARTYTHNAPLPRGAVQGLAWESSRTRINLATNRNNTLASGKRYVVFLSWPRETLPVAILDLPPRTDDYSATLPATLDGEATLRRIGN